MRLTNRATVPQKLIGGYIYRCKHTKCHKASISRSAKPPFHEFDPLTALASCLLSIALRDHSIRTCLESVLLG